MEYAFVEDQFVPFEQARLPLSDRGFLMGDGVYATVQIKEGTPLFLSRHLELLNEQAHSLNLEPPVVSSSLVRELIERNKAKEGIWRLKIIVTGGDAPEMHLPKRRGRLVLFMHPFHPLLSKALHLTLFPTPFFLCHAHFKSLAHLNRYYVMEYARREGVDDALTATEGGILLEAAFGNLLWIHEGTFYTPCPSLPLYHGVTIRVLIDVLLKQGKKVEYVKWRLPDVPDDALCFRTSSIQGIWPVAQIDDKLLAQDPIWEHQLKTWLLLEQNAERELLACS